MKQIITPYVRPDGIIVGIKGKAPEKPKVYPCNNWNVDNCPITQSGFKSCECWRYEKALTAFIQSGHPFEDQKGACRLLPPDKYRVMGTDKPITQPGLHPPIELDVDEVEQYQSKFDGEWIDRLYQGKNLPAPPDTVIRTALRIAKEEVKPTEEATETQDEAALSWLQYIEGFPKIKELWESLSKSQPVMAKLFEININNFVDSQHKPK